jgi:hypothetical protein
MDIRDTMYAVGKIFRIIWPSSGDIPKTILEVVLTRPSSGLALAVKHRDNKTADQDALGELAGKLTDICDPPNGVKGEDQLPFWSGFYHYGSALDRAKAYGPAELERAGKVLFGDRWQTDLADALDLSDARRIGQWMAKERPLPVGVWADICGLLRHRQMSIDKVLQGLV